MRATTNTINDSRFLSYIFSKSDTYEGLPFQVRTTFKLCLCLVLHSRQAPVKIAQKTLNRVQIK